MLEALRSRPCWREASNHRELQSVGFFTSQRSGDLLSRMNNHVGGIKDVQTADEQVPFRRERSATTTRPSGARSLASRDRKRDPRAAAPILQDNLRATLQGVQQVEKLGDDFSRRYLGALLLRVQPANERDDRLAIGATQTRCAASSMVAAPGCPGWVPPCREIISSRSARVSCQICWPKLAVGCWAAGPNNRSTCS